MQKWSVESGQELLSTLASRAHDEGIRNAAIVSLIGAVDVCELSNMAADDAGRDIATAFAQPFELSGTGEIINGVVHLHVSLSGEANTTVHGHLNSATVQSYFVNAYVLPLD